MFQVDRGADVVWIRQHEAAALMQLAESGAAGGVLL
jgi:hypothetical protein